MRFGLEKDGDRVFIALLGCKIERGLAEGAVARVNDLKETRSQYQ